MRSLLIFLLLCVLTACQVVRGTYPRTNTVIPDVALRLTSSYQVSLVDALQVAGVIYLTYKVVDPTAPAWEIKEVAVGDDRLLYTLQMQRVHDGGSGEARQVLLRRVRTLMREKGYADFEIARYEESIDSRIFLPRRTAEAEIVLHRAL